MSEKLETGGWPTFGNGLEQEEKLVMDNDAERSEEVEDGLVMDNSGLDGVLNASFWTHCILFCADTDIDAEDKSK